MDDRRSGKEGKGSFWVVQMTPIIGTPELIRELLIHHVGLQQLKRANQEALRGSRDRAAAGAITEVIPDLAVEE